MKNIFIISIVLTFTITFSVLAGNQNLTRTSEAETEVWMIQFGEDLIWLSDPNSLDADGDGRDDFNDLKEKWGASYKLEGKITFDPDYTLVDWNNDGIVTEDDFSGFLMIGNASEPFTGVFDGSYDTISNIWIKNEGITNAGFFGAIKGAKILHTGLHNIRLSSDSPNVGGLVGHAVKAAEEETGNRILNSFVHGEIICMAEGNAHVGGLAGLAEDLNVSECLTIVDVEGKNLTQKLGGLIGTLVGGEIENSYASGWVSGLADAGVVAGYVDQSQGNVRIQNCYGNGTAIASDPISAGGFIGRFNGGETINCYWNQEESDNNRAVGTSFTGAVKDITALTLEDFGMATSFQNWDFNETWEIGEHVSKPKIFNIHYEPPASVETILEDGQGDFDPWNTERWAEWYNDEGELIKPFIITTDIKFDTSTVKVWHPDKNSASRNYTIPFGELLMIERQGVVIDGNGIVIDVRTSNQQLPLEDLYALGKDAWWNITQLQCLHYNKLYKPGSDSTVVKNFTIKGFNRGLKIDFLGSKSHPMIVRDCEFIRNGIGIYTNSNSCLFFRNQILENGNGGIYSGSKSSDNVWRGNTFRDNTLVQYNASYGDFIGDTYYNTIIENNEFLPSLVDLGQVLRGICTFRNQGETNNLREQMPHNNIIRNNHFKGYTVGIIMGARHGRNVGYDITGEGLDYAFYNTIENNVFENTAVGIKINTEGDTIRNNQFINTDHDIVLHCVFFRLKNTTIEYQDGDSVSLWYTLDDYEEIKDWFPYEDDLNGFISRSEKIIEVHSEVEPPVFPFGPGDVFVLNPVDKGPEFMLEDHRVGLPLATDTGEFTTDLPGYEIAAIWDDPVSRVNDNDYYTIKIFDRNGIEINRAGKSEFKWGQIAVGYFLKSSGEMEIAVVPTEAVDGKYPVYIFTRGFKDPKAILYQNNTDPSIKISTNEDHELVVTFGKK